MKNCTSIFAQMLQIVKRTVFERAVRDHKAEARCKGFSSWDQFVAMLIAMLRFNLFSYRDLWMWLKDPFGVPIVEPVAIQEEFAF